MSQSKNPPEEPKPELSGIEIVTVGIKNAPSEQKISEQPAINVIPPVQMQGEEENDEEKHPHHSHLGEKQFEDHIREHVEEVIQQIEGEKEDEDVEEGSQSISQSNLDIQQKSARSQKSYRSSRSRRRRGVDKSNYQSNDQRRDDLPSSRKCFNKLCTSKKIYKKIRSRVQQNKYRFFCRTCYDNYYNNLYCQFCEQIYSTNGQNEDDDKWIGCDHCERWNHIQCEKKYRDKNIIELKDRNLPYDCLMCSQRTKTQGGKVKKVDKDQEEKITIKQKIEINRENRTLIFHKKIENFPNLEYFLQNYNYRLWMNEGQIRQDIEHLRNTCLKITPEDNTKSKFKKVKID